ncbi:phage tail tape measure protein [Anaerotalea alkaliphila]|uniref:Phage tail tape measure protein domain-containing protein n=1 Tax=Anaerotalea alkaliphila TaxID=2662126 RepID=A0A7X5HWQ2_9FIRM|nr:phage tail tape measure protein [Anaerotalea alkaliphila]NDL68016.1 hypothetical protein [Anaerotalea alkaliphila]
MTAKNQVLNKQIAEQKNKLAELTKGLKASSDKYGENDKVTQGWRQAVNKATADLNNMEGELKSNNKALDNFGKEMDDASKKSDKLDGAMGKLGNSLKSVGGAAAKTAAAGVAALGAAVAGAVVGIIKFSNDSAKAMNSFQAQTGYSTEQMKEFKEIANEVYANNFGESMEDIAESMATISQTAGLSGEKLKDATEQALLMRDTFGFDVKESIDTVNSLMANFGLTSKEAYNLIAQGAQQGANKNGDLLDIMKEYAPNFKSLGFDADEFTDTLIQGAMSGAFQIDKVGDAVKEFSIRSKDGSKSSAEGFELLGMNADKMFSAFAKGGPEAQQAFQEVTAKLYSMEDPLARNQAGVALFGTMFEDLEIEAIGALSDIEDYAKKDADALDQINKIKYNDLGSALEGLQRQIITSLGPVTEIATNSIAGIVQGIRDGDFEQVSTALTEGIKGILDGLLPMIVTTAPMVIESLVSSLTTSTTQVLPSLMEAIVKLLAAIVQVIVDNGPMLITAGVEALKTLALGLHQALPTLIIAAIEIVMAFIMALTSIWPEIIPSAIQAIVVLAEGLLQALPILLEKAPEIITTIIKAITDNLPLLIDASIQIIVAVIAAIIQNLPLLLKAAVQIVVALAGGLIAAIPTLLSVVPKWLAAIREAIYAIDWGELGKNILFGIRDGIVNAGSALGESVINSAKSALSGAKKFLQIRSPSRVFEKQVGAQIGAGMAVGITNSARQVHSAMDGLNKDLNANIQVSGSGGLLGRSPAAGQAGNRPMDVIHSGTLRVEGINNAGDLTGVVDIIMETLRREVRRG